MGEKEDEQGKDWVGRAIEQEGVILVEQVSWLGVADT